MAAMASTAVNELCSHRKLCEGLGIVMGLVRKKEPEGGKFLLLRLNGIVH